MDKYDQLKAEFDALKALVQQRQTPVENSPEAVVLLGCIGWGDDKQPIWRPIQADAQRKLMLDGSFGATIYYTAGSTPSPTLGKDGDLNFDPDGFTIYLKVAGAWVTVGQVLNVGATAGGALTGTYPNPSLADGTQLYDLAHALVLDTINRQAKDASGNVVLDFSSLAAAVLSLAIVDLADGFQATGYSTDSTVGGFWVSGKKITSVVQAVA